MASHEPFTGDKEPQQRAEAALRALGFEHGEGCGTSYFTSVSRKILTEAFDACPDCKSFRELEAATKQLQLSEKERSDGGECFTKLHSASLEEEKDEAGPG